MGNKGRPAKEKRCSTDRVIVAVGAIGQSSVIGNGVAGKAVSASVELDLTSCRIWAVPTIQVEQNKTRKIRNLERKVQVRLGWWYLNICKIDSHIVKLDHILEHNCRQND